jgi:flagellar protein FlbT
MSQHVWRFTIASWFCRRLALVTARMVAWIGVYAMTNLVLELRQGDFMIVNGAPIRFRSKARIELAAHARFLFGKQIMGPEQADTPAKRIYFALQTAYIGTEDERPGGLLRARRLIGEFQASTTSSQAREILTHALEAAEADDCYKALKLVRRIMRHEEAVIGNVGEVVCAQ